MADGSVKHPQTDFMEQPYVGTASVLVGNDHLVDFGVPAEMCSADELGHLATRLVRMATATLRVALVRGDDPSDAPRTFGVAVDGAYVLLQLAIGVQNSSETLRAQEKAHG